LIEGCRAVCPHRINVGVNLLRFILVDKVKECVHGAHHIRMRIEGTTRKTNVSRAVAAKALHPFVLAAHYAHRQATAERLAVGDHVRLDAKVFLCAATGDSEPDKHFVEDQGDTALITNPSQLREPGGIRNPIKAGVARTVEQRRISRCPRVGMQRLQWIHQHARDVAPVCKHAQRRVIHVLKCVGRSRWNRIADTRLHVAPPAVIRAAKAYQTGATRLILRKAHRLHHGFRPGHMKRDFVHTGNEFQSRYIFCDDRVVPAKYRAQVANRCRSTLNAGFVEVITKYIDTVRPGQIKELIAIKVGDEYAFRFADEHTTLDVLMDKTVELERHPIVQGELQIGNAVNDLCGHSRTVREASSVELSESHEALTAAHGDVFWCVISGKKRRAVVLVERYPFGDLPGHFRVSCQRSMFSSRQLNTSSNFWQSYQRG